MAKLNRGGRRGAGTGGASGVSGGSGGGIGGGGNSAAQNVNNPNAQAANVQIDNTTTAQAMSTSYQSFMAMSDDAKADYIDSVVKQPVPVFLANNAFQRFTYNSQMNDKPQIVSDSALDKMTGTELFRTVNSVYDSRTDIGYTADQIAAQVAKGSITRVSDSGGSVYGRGIYFANSYSDSTGGYGQARGNVKKTAVMRCKLNGNARSIDYSSAESKMRTEISRGSKLGRSLSKIATTDRKSAVSLYALSQGYNVLTSGHGYFNVLNRNAITMSDTVKGVGSSW